MTRRRALLSVSDKSGIADLGRGLADRGWELLSTGGTARALREAGLTVTDVSEVTAHPEMMDGRVKTLHPAVHAGLLARRERAEDLDAMQRHGYAPIDLVVVNLYPFRQTVARAGVTPGEAMEQVDIGGPSMLRSAAKNHTHVWAVVDPTDYPRVLEALDAGEGSPAAALRGELAAKVFRHTGAYDRAIATYLDGGEGAADGIRSGNGTLRIELCSVQGLRYGENPDQEAHFYRIGPRPAGVPALTQLHGKELSYNNILDLDGALLSLSPFAFSPRPAVCIVKHTTPCGIALGDTVEDAFRRALATDSTSAFGSVIALNRDVDEAAAEAVSELFVECIVAPGFSEEARAVLERKRNLRLLVLPESVEPAAEEPDAGWWTELAAESDLRAGRFLAGHGRLPEPLSFRSVYGGALTQTPSRPPFYGAADVDWKVVTKREPTDDEWDDLRFAWAAVFGVKSNAIVLAKGGATLGIGAGQMSRVDSSRIAVRKAADAGLDLAGSTLASDAFFPFRDGVDAAAEAGATAIVQPGGSVRDEEVVAAADEHGIAMVFTGRRLFRH